MIRSLSTCKAFFIRVALFSVRHQLNSTTVVMHFIYNMAVREQRRDNVKQRIRSYQMAQIPQSQLLKPIMSSGVSLRLPAQPCIQSFFLEGGYERAG